MTAPFSAQIETALREPLEHYCRLYALTRDGREVDLDVIGDALTVTADESWSPMWQLTATVHTPAPADLEELDPTEGCRVLLDWGYIYRGRERDVHVRALDLALIRLTEDEAAGTCALAADSDETLLQSAHRLPGDPGVPITGINELVGNAAGKGVSPFVPDVVSDFSSGYRGDMLTEVGLDIGQDFWSIIADAAGRAGVWVYCGADRRWRITTRPRVLGTSVHQLRGGPDGTMTGRTGERNRDTYANTVLLRYVWQDSARNEYAVYGTAAVPGAGRHGTARIGRISYVEDRPGPITQAQADAAAQTVLSYKLTRGSGQDIEAAAAYWLRPGHTVTVQTPARQLRQLVRRVVFNPLAGAMTVTTREPSNV